MGQIWEKVRKEEEKKTKGKAGIKNKELES